MSMAVWGIVKFKLCRGWRVLSAHWYLVHVQVYDEVSLLELVTRDALYLRSNSSEVC